MGRIEEPFFLLRQDFYGLHTETQRELFVAFRELVYRDIYFLLRDHALVEDVVQEAFLKSIAKGPKTREESNMKAWLRRVARNAAYDMMRKNKRFRQLEPLSNVSIHEEADGTVPSQEDVEEAVERMLRAEALHQAIGELKAEYRVVLLLYYIAGLSYAEIMEETGLSEQVLTQRLARARKKLAMQFTGKWGD